MLELPQQISRVVCYRERRGLCQNNLLDTTKNLLCTSEIRINLLLIVAIILIIIAIIIITIIINIIIIIIIIGGMGKECLNYHSRLAELFAIEKGEDYAKTISWIRPRTSFALLKSALICLRGTRTTVRRS